MNKITIKPDQQAWQRGLADYPAVREHIRHALNVAIDEIIEDAIDRFAHGDPSPEFEEDLNTAVAKACERVGRND